MRRDSQARTTGILQSLLVLLLLFSASPIVAQIGLYDRFPGPGDGSQMGKAATGGRTGHDFNGDGIPDFAISAPFSDEFSEHGSVRIYHGPFSDPLQFDADAVLRMPAEKLDYFGTSLAGAGNFRFGDRDVLVIGFLDSSDDEVVVAWYDDETQRYLMEALHSPVCATNQRFGFSVAGGGDFNGDGIDDIAVGSSPSPGGNRGHVSVYLGRHLSAPDTSPYFVFTGEGLDDTFGYSVAFVTSVDGDSCDELLVTAPAAGSNVGRAYVLLGRENEPPAPQDPIPPTFYSLDSSLDCQTGGCLGYECAYETPAVTIYGDPSTTGFGYGACFAGEMNDDDDPDIAVKSGSRAYVFYLSDPLPATLNAATQANLIVYAATSTDNQTMRGDADVDGDGIDDLLLGCPGNSPIQRVSILKGRPHTGYAAPIYSDDEDYCYVHYAEDGGNDSQYGRAVSSAGDVDSDGRDEFLVGAYAAEVEGVSLGEAYLYDLLPMTYVDRSSTTAMTYSGTPYSAIDLNYNGGAEDLFVSMGGANDSRLFSADLLQGGIPVFSNRTLVDVAAALPQGLRGLAVADVDNDGDPDLFAAHEETPQMLLWDEDLLPTPQFVHSGELLEDPILHTSYTDKSWTGAWADYDNDGWVDLFVGRASGGDDPSSASMEDARLLRNVLGEGIAGMVDMTASAGLVATNTACVGAAWFDLEGDGDSDLFVGDLRANGASRLYVNGGDGTFTDSTSLVGTVSSVSGVTPIDVDEDGDADVVIGRRDSNGSNIVLLRNSNGTAFVDITTIWGLDDVQATNSVIAADLDTDGDVDLLGCPSAGVSVSPRVFRNVSSDGVYFVDTFEGSGLAGGGVSGAVAGDWNGDGDYDLYLGRAATEEFFYQNRSESGADEPDGLWVAVEVVGGNGNNRYGIGALVELSVGGQVIGRAVVDGGSGRGGQQSHRVVFGTGESSGTGEVKVRWPDGWETTEAISVGTAGVNVTIYDDHPLAKVGTPSCTVTPLPNQKMNIEFTWMTEYSAPALWDEVQITEPIKNPCGVFPGAVLDHTNAGVTVSVQKVSGGYLHTLTVWHADCNAPCGFSWKPSSKVQVWENGVEVIRSWIASAWRSASVPICVQ